MGCWTVEDKVWVSDPDGAPWEIYTVLADADVMGCRTVDPVPAGAAGTSGEVCCATVTDGC